jgi:hypothetical protein
MLSNCFSCPGWYDCGSNQLRGCMMFFVLFIQQYATFGCLSFSLPCVATFYVNENILYINVLVSVISVMDFSSVFLYLVLLCVSSVICHMDSVITFFCFYIGDKCPTHFQPTSFPPLNISHTTTFIR